MDENEHKDRKYPNVSTTADNKKNEDDVKEKKLVEDLDPEKEEKNME